MNADEMARRQGFPDAATMQAWMRHRSESLRRDNTVARQGQPGGPAAPVVPAETRQQPAGIGALFNYIAQAMAGGR